MVKKYKIIYSNHLSVKILKFSLGKCNVFVYLHLCCSPPVLLRVLFLTVCVAEVVDRIT